MLNLHHEDAAKNGPVVHEENRTEEVEEGRLETSSERRGEKLGGGVNRC